MAVPAFYYFFEPVLRALNDAGEPVFRNDIRRRVEPFLNLSEDDKREIAGSGGMSGGLTKVATRAGWALSYTKAMGWVDNVARGYWKISDAGKAILQQYPDGIPESVLLEVVRRAREARRVKRIERDRVRDRPSQRPFVSNDDDHSATPTERIDSAYSEHRDVVAEALLAQVRGADPAFFESLVLRLLNAMGYGPDETSFERTGGSGDGGIDGVIYLDRLGLERVYVQAKRYADGNPVGRPALQSFLGAITHRNAAKGVFITSSTFSKDANNLRRTAMELFRSMAANSPSS
ncbi:MAG: restriction endonuclease [Polyangiales bacterium]